MFWSSMLTGLATAGAASALVAPSKRADVCNGYSELCGRGYGNTTFLASHDSFAYSDSAVDVARTQEVDIPTQLDLGARMLQAQAHMNDGDLHFCHTSCLLFDGGKVSDYLKTVKTWIDNNPNEVLTFVFTNPEGVSIADHWKPAFDDAGLTDLAYVPPSLPMARGDWPTLGELIDTGKKLIVFMDADSNLEEANFILPQFDMLWEPPFSSTDDTFPCSVDRISGDLSPEDHLHMLNHNLNSKVFGSDDILIPNRIDASTTNSVASIEADAAGCAPLAGDKAPNFVMIDWVNVGAASDAVKQLNGF